MVPRCSPLVTVHGAPSTPVRDFGAPERLEGKGKLKESFIPCVRASGCQTSGKLRRAVSLLEGGAGPERLGTNTCSAFHPGGKEFLPPEATQAGQWSKEASQLLGEGGGKELGGWGGPRQGQIWHEAKEAGASGPLACQDPFRFLGGTLSNGLTFVKDGKVRYIHYNQLRLQSSHASIP